MRFNKFHIISGIGGILCTACSSQLQANYGSSLFDFADSVNVEWKYFDESLVVPMSYSLAAGDSCMYLLGLIDGEWAHALDVNTGKFVRDYATKGQGPYEIVFGANIGVLSSSGETYIYDMGTKCIKFYNANGSCINVVKLNDNFNAAWNAWMLSDDRILVSSPIKNHINDVMHRGVSILDANTGKIVCAYDSIPECLIENSGSHNLQSASAISPNGKHYVLGTTIGCMLEIYGIDSKRISLVASDYNTPAKIAKTRIDPASVIGFTSITADNDYIYGAYAETTNQFDANKIGIWDWSGKLIRQIRTNAMITKMAVSSDGTKIYAVVMQDDGAIRLAYINL